MNRNPFVQAVDTYFMFQEEQISFKGLGVGNWLNLEHFMFGLPTPDEMIQNSMHKIFGTEKSIAMMKDYRDFFLREEDFIFLSSIGINLLRVPFNHRLFLSDDNTNRLNDEGFRQFDRLFQLAEKYRIFILPDLHTTPGSQNPDWHSDNSYGVPMFWKYKSLRDQAVLIWKEIAKRYSGERYLLGYDLLNEPAMAGWEGINEFYGEAIKAIREHDPNHLIVLEGDMFSMKFDGLKHFIDQNIAIGFHYYPTVWHPELLSPDLTRQQRCKKIIDGLIMLLDETKQFQIPVLCGEFGYGKDCGSSMLRNELLQDTIDLFQTENISWCLWAYKDANFMSLVSPEDHGVWMSLVRRIEEKWTQEIEKEQASEVLGIIRNQYFPKMSKEEEYLLQFRIRAILYSLQQKYILEPLLEEVGASRFTDALRNFQFTNTKMNQDMLKVLSKI